MVGNQKTEFIEKVRLWVGSEEGKKAILKALEQSEKEIAELEKARYVDPKCLNEVITI